MEVGSSVKREKNGQGAGVRKRRRLKYDVVEDDWGALKEEKTTSEGAKNELCGAEVDVGGEAAPDQPEQPEGATAQPSDELGRRAALRPPLSIPPIQSEGGNVDNVMKMKSGGYDQLLNPRWLAQSSFGDFFKRKVVDIAMTDRVKESNVLEGVAGERLRPETMVTSPITTDDCSNDDQNSFSITLSMRSDDNDNHRPMRMIDDEGNKEDISTI